MRILTALTAPRRWFAFLAVLASAGVLVGAVIAAQLGPAEEIAELQAAIERDPLVRVAQISETGSARARDVFLQRTSSGHLCMWDAPANKPRERMGGCNPVDDPLAGRAFSASLGYDGGPATTDVRDARLTGLASEEVADLFVVMSDGTHRMLSLRNASIDGVEYRVFAHRFRPSNMRKGVGPVAVVALDDAGAEIGRQPTGFG